MLALGLASAGSFARAVVAARARGACTPARAAVVIVRVEVEAPGGGLTTGLPPAASRTPVAGAHGLATRRHAVLAAAAAAGSTATAAEQGAARIGRARARRRPPHPAILVAVASAAVVAADEGVAADRRARVLTTPAVRCRARQVALATVVVPSGRKLAVAESRITARRAEALLARKGVDIGRVTGTVAGSAVVRAEARFDFAAGFGVGVAVLEARVAGSDRASALIARGRGVGDDTRVAGVDVCASGLWVVQADAEGVAELLILITPTGSCGTCCACGTRGATRTAGRATRTARAAVSARIRRSRVVRELVVVVRAPGAPRHKRHDYPEELRPH